MKPRLAAFVAAEGIAIDQLSGRVTAFNMIDHVVVAGFPTMLLRVSTIAAYELADEEEQFSERVRILDPDGAQVSESNSHVVLSSRELNLPPNSHRSIHVLWRVPLKQPGDYRVVLESHRGDGWQQLASICLTAVVQVHPTLNAAHPEIPVAPTASDESGPKR